MNINVPSTPLSPAGRDGLVMKIELGVKYRFIEQTTNCPDVGIFPLLEVPTGDAKLGLGSGQLQAFLPVWIQKSFGKWTTYGGGGYWINPGTGNRDWWYAGWLLQRQVTTNLAVGAEIYRETAQTVGGSPDTRFNVGSIFDFSENHHLMFSVGHTITGPSAFQARISRFNLLLARSRRRRNEKRQPTSSSQNGATKAAGFPLDLADFMAGKYSQHMSERIEINPRVCGGQPVIKAREFLFQPFWNNWPTTNLGIPCWVDTRN